MTHLGVRYVQVPKEDHHAYSACSLDTCDEHVRVLPYSYGGEGYCSRKCCATAMQRVGDDEGVDALYDHSSRVEGGEDGGE